VRLFNRGTQPATIQVDWSTLTLPAKSYKVRDLWANQDLGPQTAASATVEPHGVVLLRRKP